MFAFSENLHETQTPASARCSLIVIQRFCHFQVFVIAATLINWDFSKLLKGPEKAWVGNYFFLNWAVRWCCNDYCSF
jgi:hypothetical protein